MPTANSYSAADVTVLDTRRTPIQKQLPVMPSRAEPEIFYGGRHMDLFNLISAPNPTKVKIGTRPRAAHEVPLLSVTVNRVIDMEDPAPAVVSQEVPSAENIATTKVVPEVNLEKEIATMRPLINKKRRKRDRSAVEANAPPKVLRKDHASVHPTQNTRGGKSLASMGVGPEPPSHTSVRQSVSDPDPLSYVEPQPIHDQDIASVLTSSKGTTTEIPTEGVAATEVNVQFPVGSPESGRSTFAPSIVGSPSGIYQPGWGVTNDCRLDTQRRAKICPGSRRNERIQVREEEIKRLGEDVESLKVLETKVHGLRNQTKNLETLLEAEVDMKKATEAKNAELAKELESLRAKFSDLQLNSNQLSQQVSTLQAQVTGEERIKAEFEEFKKYEDNKVEQRCVEMDTRLDKLSVDIDEELYPHMLTAIADQLEKLKDALMELIMASLHLESDTGEDAPQWIRDLRPSSSQVKIPIYPEVRAHEDPWAVKEEVSLEDAIAANISRAEKKKKCRVVCCTHGIGSAHHVGSDGIPVSSPTVVPRGLAILLTDAGTQTRRFEDEASPRFLRSKSLPPMYNLDWP
ncbi:hypothetical protein Tco_0296638 [Tanacetum coccineum]